MFFFFFFLVKIDTHTFPFPLTTSQFPYVCVFLLQFLPRSASPIESMSLNEYCVKVSMCILTESVWILIQYISPVCLCAYVSTVFVAQNQFFLKHQRPDVWISVQSGFLFLFCQSGKAVLKGAVPCSSGDISSILSGFLILNPAALTAATRWTNIHIWVFLLSTHALLLLQFWQENVHRCRTSDALMNSTMTSGRNKALCWVRSAWHLMAVSWRRWMLQTAAMRRVCETGLKSVDFSSFRN